MRRGEVYTGRISRDTAVLHARSEGFEYIPSSERPLHLVINIAFESL